MGNDSLKGRIVALFHRKPLNFHCSEQRHIDAPTDRRVYDRRRGEQTLWTPHATGVGSCVLYFRTGFSGPSVEYLAQSHALFMRVA
nr:MAG TPA: hypothetical protein [Caudoviricetes sp.]DAR28687.1 MAG TPA: hypothetical protein [Caudoviricetes sp.]